ncbi:MAG: GDSL-type esterase/lipase family protein [Cytophagaceae bacterium]|nr:GDSL-type esterase/lipase family protein [Cytophagaceae bacterium]
MNYFKSSLTVLLLVSLLAFRSTKPTKVVFFGDSITQAGVSPTGYITKLGQLLEKAGKKADYELVGKGIGGNKVYDLFLRMDEDVLAQKPDVVVVWVGVNDVWHKRTSGTGTDPDKFVKFYEAIIKKLKDNGIRPIVCTPSTIGERTDFSNEQDGDLQRYATLIREVAARQNVPVCDLRKAFLDYNLKNNPKNEEKGILTTDRVHLNESGNQFVAEQMLAVLTK